MDMPWSLAKSLSTHILNTIKQARNSKPEQIKYYNINETIVTRNISQIIDLFMNHTVNFNEQACLKVRERDMGRELMNNCYAEMASLIRDTIARDYVTVVCEKAYCVTAFFNRPAVMYEFFLGPLYIGVYRNN
ncbi:unnamed protein product [Oppiella nova]|uniref:Uncharacterized protein n=1 Tax=Oppiella nova TaxID=334625 RepID=A0A7R9MDY9_9ACAR|nr:unnamed protein product [Oppiella nova]CAG2174406.1 unnamed protein product [Oppiella nova]